MKIDLSNMEAILKFSVPTNYNDVRSFIGVLEYLKKFIASFSTIAAPLHIVTSSGKKFQWGKGKKRVSDELRKNISEALVLELLNT